MKHHWILSTALIAILASGCAPAVIGGGAAGGYKTATDERTVGNIIDDTTVATRVKTALIREERVKARNIDVDVLEGRVTLTGVVDSQAEASRAVTIAHQAKGVRSVRNNLQWGDVTIGQSVDDTVIYTKIKSALIGADDIRSLNIDVDVNRSVVTLSGIVKGSGQKSRIIGIARNTAGVKQVVDNLTVK
jgi:hyperosmotically inducible periplasmic protein